QRVRLAGSRTTPRYLVVTDDVTGRGVLRLGEPVADRVDRPLQPVRGRATQVGHARRRLAPGPRRPGRDQPPPRVVAEALGLVATGLGHIPDGDDVAGRVALVMPVDDRPRAVLRLHHLAHQPPVHRVVVVVALHVRPARDLPGHDGRFAEGRVQLTGH